MKKMFLLHLLLLMASSALSMQKNEQKSKNFLLLTPQAIGMSSVISNSIEDIEEHPEQDKDGKIKIESPILEQFSFQEVKNFEDLLNDMPGVIDIEELIKAKKSINYEDALILLKLCDAFDVKDALQPLQDLILLFINQEILHIPNQISDRVSDLLKKAYLVESVLPLSLKSNVVHYFINKSPMLLPVLPYVLNKPHNQYIDYETARALQILPAKIGQNFYTIAWDGHNKVLRLQFSTDPYIQDNNGVVKLMTSNVRGQAGTFYIYDIDTQKVMSAFKSTIDCVLENNIQQNKYFGKSLVMWLGEENINLYTLDTKIFKQLPIVADSLVVNKKGTLCAVTARYHNTMHIKIMRIIKKNVNNSQYFALESYQSIDLKNPKNPLLSINDEGTLVAYRHIDESGKFSTPILYDVAQQKSEMIYDDNEPLKLNTWTQYTMRFSSDNRFLFIVDNNILRIIDTKTKKQCKRLELKKSFYDMSVTKDALIFTDRGNAYDTLYKLPLDILSKFLDKDALSMTDFIALKILSQCGTLKISAQSKEFIDNNNHVLHYLSNEVQRVLFGKIIVDNKEDNNRLEN